MSKEYESAGVSLEAGYESVRRSRSILPPPADLV